MSYENIPQELKELKQWVCWKKITNEKGKATKIPISAINGSNAMSNNPLTWTTFDKAVEAVKTYNLSGIGFMFANGYFGIDLDDCSEQLKEEFMSTLNSYTEISQSGNGIHIICKGKLPDGPRRKNGIEMYDSQRFFVMTGNSLTKPEIYDRTNEVKKLFDKYLVTSKQEDEIYKFDIPPTSSNLDDNEIIKKASMSKNGGLFSLLFAGQWEGVYESQSEADMAFCFLLAFWTRKDKQQMDRIIRLSGLMRPKWDRKQNNTTYGAITIENACNKTLNVYDPQMKEKEVMVNAKTGEVVFSKNKDYELNDTGNAHRFVDRYGDEIKYNLDNRNYMVWKGTHWANDTELTIKNMCEIVIDEMRKDALAEDDKEIQKMKMRNVQHAYSSRGKEAMLKESIHLPGLPVNNTDFDKSKKFINTLSGVVDLSTGKMLEHHKDFMMSKVIPINVSDKEPKLWLKFLNEIFGNDHELIGFIQKAVGYTITGSIKEQCMFICYGDGANGKSVFLDVISTLLGDYAVNAQVDTILYNKTPGAASSDLARLKGARLVTTGEPNEGSKFNEGLVKQLTGGDKITARFLYGKEFEFRPEFKLWLATNYRPVIRGTDGGIWRRIRLIPFEMKLPKEKQDRDLTAKLLKELPEIFNWAVQGTIKWLKEGLESPSTVEEATKDYKNEMDIINTFVDECCSVVPGWETNVSDVYQVYSDWARRGNEYLMPLTRFGKEMGKRFEKKRRSQGIVYINVRLNKDTTQYTFDKFKV
jgi:putative DNA primase/helicase